MPFLSYADARVTEGRKDVVLREARAREARGSTVFLSHSSKDDDHVAGVIEFFRRFDALVYVDLLDKSLDGIPSAAAAARLKERIAVCRRFVVLVTANSKESRWVPWELGLADGAKGMVAVGLLPMTPTGDEEPWAKVEYFQLYPRIYRLGDEWYVLDPRDMTPWKLRSWLHNV